MSRPVRTCVNIEPIFGDEGERQIAEEIEMGGRKLRARPFCCDARVLRHAVAGLNDSLVVVAEDAEGSAGDQLGGRLDRMDRVRSRSDEVAKKDGLVRAKAADDFQHRVEGFAVGMDVGQDGDAHLASVRT